MIFSLLTYKHGRPVAYGSSQARGRIGATAASLGHSNMGFDPHLQPTPHLQQPQILNP